MLIAHGSLLARNNLQVIDSLVNEITIDILEAGNKRISKNVVLKIGDFKQNLNSYLSTKIGNILTENNYQAFRNFPKDTSFEFTVFEIQNFALDIKYSEPFSDGFFDDELVQRIVDLKLTGQVYNGESLEIIIPIKKNKKFVDEINYKNIEKMEESPYQFTFGEKAGLTAWQKLFEPVLVMSSVLTVLLLLFTQRS